MNVIASVCSTASHWLCPIFAPYPVIENESCMCDPTDIIRFLWTLWTGYFVWVIVLFSFFAICCLVLCTVEVPCLSASSKSLEWLPCSREGNHFRKEKSLYVTCPSLLSSLPCGWKFYEFWSGNFCGCVSCFHHFFLYALKPEAIDTLPTDSPCCC